MLYTSPRSKISISIPSNPAFGFCATSAWDVFIANLFSFKFQQNYAYSLNVTTQTWRRNVLSPQDFALTCCFVREANPTVSKHPFKQIRRMWEILIKFVFLCKNSNGLPDISPNLTSGFCRLNFKSCLYNMCSLSFFMTTKLQISSIWILDYIVRWTYMWAKFPLMRYTSSHPKISIPSQSYLSNIQP